MAKSFDFKQIQAVNSFLALFPTGPYGIEHSYRLFKILDQLADLEKMNHEDRSGLKFSALFLNIGRESNKMKYNFAHKSYQKLKDKQFFEKESFNNELTRFLIECHSTDIKKVLDKLNFYTLDDPNKAVFLLKVLKDALILERFRFGNFCAVDLEFSNSKKMVLFASQFSRKELNQTKVQMEIEAWLKTL